MKVRDYKGDLVEAPKDHRELVASIGDVVWSRNSKQHQIRYGLQVSIFKSDIDAAKEFGLCVRHQAECTGKFDN